LIDVEEGIEKVFLLPDEYAHIVREQTVKANVFETQLIVGLS
jgi:hypothetical protein